MPWQLRASGPESRRICAAAQFSLRLGAQQPPGLGEVDVVEAEVAAHLIGRHLQRRVGEGPGQLEELRAVALREGVAASARTVAALYASTAPDWVTHTLGRLIR
jgi:hypothetical protein